MESISNLIQTSFLIAVFFYLIQFCVYFTEGFFTDTSNERTLSFESLDEYKQWIDKNQEELDYHKEDYKKRLSNVKKKKSKSE